jgi:hypothetical protein
MRVKCAEDTVAPGCCVDTISECLLNSRWSGNERAVGLVLLLAGIMLGYGNRVFARKGGEGHQSGDGVRDPGRAALGHRSQKGSENSNAQWSTGATRGQNRAALRNQGSRARHNKKYSGKVRSHDKGYAAHGNQDRNSH